MFLELHILQNFAPSNLNRDESGAPKDCEFGGVRRARVSSQCIKRAMRQVFRDEQLVPDNRLAERTKRLQKELVDKLKARGREEDASASVVEAALGGISLRVEDGKTQYLLFLGVTEIDRLADLCDQNWDTLTEVASNSSKQKEGQSKRDAKKAASKSLPPEIHQAILKALDGGKAADLSLFGRMLADLPERNIDAACQVAHAISTNRVSVEFDFYTAVDDLQPDDTQGADMLGTVEFNSACYYRYCNLDVKQLLANLQGDEGLARATVGGFLKSAIRAVPTGKQNSMAAQNPPSLVLAVARERLCSLANAFVRPVSSGKNGDLVEGSVRALDDYWARLARMYGEKDIAGKWCVTTHPEALSALKDCVVDNVDEVIDRSLALAASFELARADGALVGAAAVKGSPQ